MFKNRIRTAALAGAIAVATGISGVAVPAFAQDSVPTENLNNGFNKADGSKAEGTDAKNITELELWEITHGIKKYIDNNDQYKDAILRAVEEAKKATGTNPEQGDQSEEQARNELDRLKADATKALEISEANVQKARASVQYALQMDRAADEAWVAFDKAADAARDTIDPASGKRIIGEVNVALNALDAAVEGKNLPDDLRKQIEESGWTFDYVPSLPRDGQNTKWTITDAEAKATHPTEWQRAHYKGNLGSDDVATQTKDLGVTVDSIDEGTRTLLANEVLTKLYEARLVELKEALNKASQRNADKDAKEYVNRYYIPALENAIAVVEKNLEKLTSLQDAAKKASAEAQKSDVLVRQAFLDRAYAQLRLVRVIEARFAVAAREVELYEHPEQNTNVTINGKDYTLRALYDALINGGNLSGNLSGNAGAGDPGKADNSINVNGAPFEQNVLGNYIEINKKELEEVDKGTFLGWASDLKNYDGDWGDNLNWENVKYANLVETAKRDAYGDIARDTKWTEAVKLVENKDQESLNSAADKAAAADAAKEAAERQKQIAEALGKLAGGNNNGGTTGNGSAGKTDGSSKVSAGSSTGDNKGLIIGGIVAAVLAAIVAALPTIAKTLNIKLPF